ncbi:MAG: FAD-binding oxidoreductase [Ottowia sp.]|uniref:NAD(P)/FAD-dependent oxidoreductase n=1 Tax=unclassified Ottowia TaxID=2645081 RepID=UPI003C2EEAB3
MSRRSDDLFSSDFRPEPYWWREFRPTPLETSDPGRTHDVAVVGGGYAGLAVALEVARHGLSVIVFEAGLFGEGASTRSGGALSAGLSIGKSLTGKALDYPPQVVDMVVGWARDSFAHLERFIEQERIDCHFERRGRFLGACAPRHYDWLKVRFEKLQRSGAKDCRLIERGEQRQEIGSDFYHGGLVFNAAAKLHPALLYRGYLQACLRQPGITLVDQTRVHGLERSSNGRGSGWALDTERGRFSARQVAVCTNGYTGDLVPKLHHRLVPVASHIIVTEEIPPELAKRISPNGRTFSETRRIMHYFRLTPDGKRVLFGGRSRFTETPFELNAKLLHNSLVRRFPELADVRVAHAWQGNVAFSGDALPHAGEFDGVHYVAACCGGGITVMPYLGSQVGQKIAGTVTGQTDFDRVALPPIPFYRGKPWFLPVVGTAFRVADYVDENIL